MKKLKIIALLFVLGVFTISCGDEFTEIVVDEITMESDKAGNPTDPADRDE
ncbi:MAG: hypothetical protein R8G66_06180 [Cytophagales bacterium]|nr:hypothetical protein [Cytophagales bacterium]